MAIVWGALHKLSRRLNYGLRRRQRRRKSGDGKPVGPRLVRWSLRREPYSERAHHGRVRYARLVLLVVGVASVVIGPIRCIYVVDDAAAFYAALGIVFLILHAVSRKRPEPALWIGLVLFAVAICRTSMALVEFAAEPYEAAELLVSLFILGYAIMLGVLLTLLAGAKSAMALAKKEAEGHDETGSGARNPEPSREAPGSNPSGECGT